MKDISGSFGAKRSERKEYRAAKKDAFEKARDRGDLKFDATTPLDSSFTSLTAATAANIFAKHKARRAVKKDFNKSYLANKASKNVASTSIPTAVTSNTVRGNDASEANYDKERKEINDRIEKSRNAYTPDTESKSIARNTYTPKNEVKSVNTKTSTSKTSSSPSKGMAPAFSPERIAQYKKKGWAMDHTTHRSTSNKIEGGAPKDYDFMSYNSKKGQKTTSSQAKNTITSPIANNPIQAIRQNNPLRSFRDYILSNK
jgi:hypothetical protein